MPATAASAQTTTDPIQTSGYAVSANTIADHQVMGEGEFAGFDIGNEVTEAFTCVAEATPDAVSTAITSCVLSGAPALPVAAPGPVSTTTGEHTFDLAQLTSPLQLCWTVEATYIEDVVGPLTVSSAGCTSAFP